MAVIDVLLIAPEGEGVALPLLEGDECRLRRVETVAAGLTVWQTHRPDVVLLWLLDPADLGFLATLAADTPDLWDGEPLRLPVVVIVAAQQEHLADQALQQGAWGYLVQGQMTPLGLRQTLRQVMDYQRLGHRCRQGQQQAPESDSLLTEQAQFIQTLLQASTAILYLYDVPSQRHLYLSQETADALGYPLAHLQAMGANFVPTLMHPDDFQRRLPQHLQRVEQSPPGIVVEFEYRMRHANGEWLWFYSRDLVFKRDAAGNVQQIVGSALNIQARKASEQMIEQALQRAAAENRQFQQAIEQAATSYRHLFACNPQPMWVYDLETLRFLAVNEAAVAKYGYSEAEFLAMTIADIRPPEDVPRLLDNVALVDAGLDLAGIWQHCLRDGQIIQVEIVSYALTFEGRRAELVMAQDVTDRVQAELALQQLNRDLEQRVAERTTALATSEAQLQAILDCSPAIIYVKDLEGRHLLVNRAFTRLFNCDAADIIGKTNHDLFSGAMADGLAANDQYLLSLGAVHQFEETIAIGDQQRFFLSDKFVLRDEQGQPYALCGMSTDITDLKVIQRALRESEQLLETILATTPIPIFWKDRQLRYRGGNQVAATTLGLTSPADLVGKTDADLPWPAADAAAFQMEDQQVIASGQPSLNQVYHLNLRNGVELWLEMNKVPLRDSRGQIIGILGTAQDIGDRKQAELDLQRTNQELERATRLKDEFLANMSHELRTPLNAILGISESLQEAVYGPITDQQQQSIATIERTGHHLLDLINDILDVAKIEAGQMELHYSAIDVQQLCESSLTFVKEQATKKHIQLSTSLPDKLLALSADERRLRQVLINLLNNAVKFTPAGGRVSLAVGYVPLPVNQTAPGVDGAPEAETGTQTEARTGTETEITSHIGLRFTVTDTGIGIRAEDIPILFQPFRQIDGVLNRQHGGTGLGLALVKRIVELHGGTVSLTSEVGAGSCFAFTLPLPHFAKVQPSPLDAAPPAGLPTAATGTRRILLAEDNPDNVDTLRAYLEMQGYTVLLAADGATAIAVATAERPDIIVMDIQMPGMDGLEAMRRIRAHPDIAPIPIIALTAFAMPGDEERCLAAGANTYLSKPVKLKHLAATIRQWLP